MSSYSLPSDGAPPSTIDSEVDKIFGDLFVATHGGKTAADLGRDNLDSIDYSEAAQTIKNLIAQEANKAVLKAVREDRLANAEFWKDKIDRMFDGEIATYKNALTADKEQNE